MQWQYFLEFISENGQGAVEKITQNWQVKSVVGAIGAWAVTVCEHISTPFALFAWLVIIDFASKMMALGNQYMKNNNIQGNYFHAIWYGFTKTEASQSFPMRTKGVNKIVQYFCPGCRLPAGKTYPDCIQ